MKIALVHDQLQEFGGAERVLIALKDIFPEADVYTSFYNPHTLGKHADKFKDWNIITSWADHIPGLKKLYSPFRFLGPWIWESFNFSNYDIVISSSGMYMSKGIITRPETVHLCYFHHQPKHLYYYQTAVEWQKATLIKIYGHLINHGLRTWDYISSQRPDHFIANSEETKKRIYKFYRRDAEVIYPPVNVPHTFRTVPISEKKYYLTLSRLAGAKNIDILIKAANKYKFQLKIVGTGRDEQTLKQIAGESVEFLGSVPDNEFDQLYHHAKAFLNAAVDEEFGISVVEAMGFGVPVIGYASGGIKETIREGKNGYLYHTLDENALYEKIKVLESLPEMQYSKMQENAYKASQEYSFENFKQKILKFVSNITSH